MIDPNEELRIKRKAWGAIGGKSRSRAKVKAVKRNGRKGGRPRKGKL